MRAFSRVERWRRISSSESSTIDGSVAPPIKLVIAITSFAARVRGKATNSRRCPGCELFRRAGPGSRSLRVSRQSAGRNIRAATTATGAYAIPERVCASRGSEDASKCAAAYAGVAITTAAAESFSFLPLLHERILIGSPPRRLTDVRIFEHASSYAALAKFRGQRASEASPTPCRNEHSGGGPFPLLRFERDFIAPRRTLPYSRSHSSRVGNAALRLSFSGSPA